MIVPSIRNAVYFQGTNVANGWLIMETPSELTFSTKMFGNVDNALNKSRKINVKHWTKLPTIDGKRCKCVTNHWRTLYRMHCNAIKCVEMHWNFIKDPPSTNRHCVPRNNFLI